MKLSKSQELVLDFFKAKRNVAQEFFSPTEIARNLDPILPPRRTPRHSAWASPICKALVKKGFLKRSSRGWYALN